MKPTITVAIPSYNKEHCIKRCLASALQEKKYLEKIILIDNNSTDRTFEIAKSFEPVVTCIQNESNLGMAGNWNRCIDECTTDWLLILHADDELLPGAMNHYMDMIEKYPSLGIIHAHSYSIVEEENLLRKTEADNQKEFWHKGLDAMKCHYGVCSSVLVKKEAYAKLGYFIESLSSDAEMWSRIASTYDTGFMKEPTSIYHISQSSTGYESLVKRSIKEIKKDWDFLSEKTADNYPTKESREAYLQKSKKGSVYGFFAVTKANMRAGNYYKALQAVHLIIFVYGGSLLLLKMTFEILKNKLNPIRRIH
jgi:glycosyltransferase involved in cell wall biosynthesis